MDSKDAFLRIWERESQTTIRVFKAFPRDRLEFKPHEQSRSARDLAWQCVVDEGVIGMIEDQNDLRNAPTGKPPPQTMEEIVAAYEGSFWGARRMSRKTAAVMLPSNIPETTVYPTQKTS